METKTLENKAPKCPHCGREMEYSLIDPSEGDWDWFCWPCFNNAVNEMTDGDWTNLVN